MLKGVVQHDINGEGVFFGETVHLILELGKLCIDYCGGKSA